MPTSKEHFEYTLNEWSSQPFTKIIERLSGVSLMFDVGANVGGFSQVVLDKFPRARVYGFEPLGRNMVELKKNIPNGIHFPVAIYYGPTESKLFWRGSNDGAVFLEEVDAGPDKVPVNEVVKVITLEDVVSTPPDLVKLDVEGAEVNIIENSTLLKNTTWIIVEWHPDHIDPVPFLSQHLPRHKIIENIDNKQFLLKYD